MPLKIKLPWMQVTKHRNSFVFLDITKCAKNSNESMRINMWSLPIFEPELHV